MKDIQILMGFFILSTLFLSGCTSYDSQQSEESELMEQTPNDSFTPVDEQTGFPVDNTTPDQDPNEILATVGTQQITHGDVLQNQQMLFQQGTQASEDEVLEQIIREIALRQKVQEEGISVSTEEVEELIENELERQNLSLDQYKQQLEDQGVSYLQELEYIKYQISVQNYLDLHLNETFEVSDEDAEAFFALIEQQYPNQTFVYEEEEAQIKDILEQEKKQQAMDSLIDQIVLDADVQYN